MLGRQIEVVPDQRVLDIDEQSIGQLADVTTKRRNGIRPAAVFLDAGDGAANVHGVALEEPLEFVERIPALHGFACHGGGRSSAASTRGLILQLHLQPIAHQEDRLSNPIKIRLLPPRPEPVPGRLDQKKTFSERSEASMRVRGAPTW